MVSALIVFLIDFFWLSSFQPYYFIKEAFVRKPKGFKLCLKLVNVKFNKNKLKEFEK